MPNSLPPDLFARGSHASSLNQQRIRVLVVDDHLFSRKLLGQQCVALGYGCALAEGGRAAMRLLLDQRYDVVLTDLRMPGMDGCALAECLRDAYPELPVIAVTGALEAEDTARCRRAGMVDALTKPLDMAELDRVIRRHVLAAADTAYVRHEVARHVPLTLSAERAAVLERESFRRLDRMDAACDGLAFDALRDDAHAMKGAFAMVRETALVTACESIERAAGCQADINALRAGLSELRKALDIAIERWIASTVEAAK